jgi:uncharacterized protein with PQ loop repeat
MFKKPVSPWEILGLVASLGSIAAYVPQIIDLCIHPEKAVEINVWLFSIECFANILWTIYGIGIESIAVTICSAIIGMN